MGRWLLIRFLPYFDMFLKVRISKLKVQKSIKDGQNSNVKCLVSEFKCQVSGARAEPDLN